MQRRFKSARWRARLGRASLGRAWPDEGEGGFIAIDALVALTLISMTLALVLVAGHTAIKISERAGQIETARTSLIAAVERTPARPGETTLNTAAGLLTLVVRPAAAPSEGVCLIHASLRGAGARRSYQFDAARPCERTAASVPQAHM